MGSWLHIHVYIHIRPLIYSYVFMYVCFDDWALVAELCSISHCIEEMKQENAFNLPYSCTVHDIVYTLQATIHCHLNLLLSCSLHCKHGKQAIGIQIIQTF